MGSSPARRAHEAYFRDRWQILLNAHALLVRGSVHSSLKEYRRVLRGLPDLMGDGIVSWPQFSGHPREASHASAVILLYPFYQLTKTWRPWPLLASPLRTSPAYHAQPMIVRAHVEAGWAAAHNGLIPPETLLAELERLLHAERWDGSADSRWTQVALHIAAAEACNTAMRSAAAIAHGAEALELLKDSATPYYAIRIHEEIGNAHYNAATIDNDPALYDAARRHFDLADDLVADIGHEAWAMGREYDKGWLYAKLGEYDAAIAHFERGALRRTGAGLLYDAGRCHYGMGYALLMKRQYAAARHALTLALRLFSDNDHAEMNQDALGSGSSSPRMIALVVQIMGLVDQDEGDFESALENLELSLMHMEGLNAPTVLFDTLMPLIEVCAKLGDHARLARYQGQLAALRRTYVLPHGHR